MLIATYAERHNVEKISAWQLALTICDPVASHVQPESSVSPPQSFRNDLFHHRHVKIDGVVEKQGVDRTLYTENLV